MSKDDSPCRVTAHLSHGFAGDAPYLDSILELYRSHDDENSTPRGTEVPREKVGKIKIPIRREQLAGWPIPLSSAPIFRAEHDSHAHFSRSLATIDASLLHPDNRIVLNTTGGKTKSYRLPLRVRTCDSMVWFCFAQPRWLRRLLDLVAWVGKKNSHGYGRVLSWSVDETDRELWWYGPSDQGPVLMRRLPYGGHLPDNLLGARRSYGGCVGPYWQRSLYTEIVEPC